MARVSLNDQLQHLKKDKSLKKVINEVGILKGKTDKDLYLSLLSAIVGQQLSVKAADTIWNRFLLLFKDEYPHPKLVLKLDIEKMRAAGLSYQKAGYIKNIAEFSIKESLDYQQLKSLSDEELIDYLVKIKGVGRWTVEMILMFALNRPDVFPVDDLGIQTGMKKLYGITSQNKKELYLKMNNVAQNWKPYRTLACKYIWKFKDTK